MTSFQKLAKAYHKTLVSLIASAGNISNPDALCIYIDRAGRTAIIRANNPPLTYTDGALLKCIEEISEEQWETRSFKRETYSFHYSSGDFFFRYDRDPEASVDHAGEKRYDHAENHIHVGRESPRYITHSTGLDEVLRFIDACFYRE